MDVTPIASDHSGFCLDARLSMMTRDWLNMVSEKEEERDPRQARIPEKTTRKQRTFCTGSQYFGQTDHLGFSGIGSYTYPHGVRYEGSFYDGRFHGEGSLVYPNGSRLLGKWKKGKMIMYRFFFGDGLEVRDPWTYLDFPDRTLHGEGQDYYNYSEDILDNVLINNNCYDTRDGIYDPRTKCVHDKYLRIIRIVTPAEEHKITSSFRARVQDRVGYRPDLYEYWTSGIRSEIELITEGQSVKKNSSELTVFNPCPSRSSN
nr:unnamed protein product [Callosobruchus analis]